MCARHPLGLTRPPELRPPQPAHSQVDIFVGCRVGQAKEKVDLTYRAQAPSDRAGAQAVALRGNKIAHRICIGGERLKPLHIAIVGKFLHVRVVGAQCRRSVGPFKALEFLSPIVFRKFQEVI